MSDRMYFGKPEDLKIGDLVWYYRTEVLIGPLLIVDSRRGGYGANGQKYWIMFDSRTGDYHQSTSMWLRVPKPCIKEEE